VITVALTYLLSRGVHLSVSEALAIALSAAAGPGDAAIGNIELGSDGSVRCVARTGVTTIASLAALLNELLPAGGVPGALRYAIARAAGTVVAPPFASIEEFCRALARFAPADRAETIRHLLSRAAAPACKPRPIVAEPAADVVLQRAEAAVMPRRGRRSRRFAAIAAALLLSALGGYAAERAWGGRFVTRMPALDGGVLPAVPPDPAVDRAVPDVRQVATIGRAGGREAEELLPHGFSPAFSANGGAVFFQTGGPRDRSSAIAVAAATESTDSGLRIATVIDNGARNYHAQPSPDGRWIAFDSDRDGVRGVYVAARDGSNVRRVSGGGYAALPTWSPDGARLAFVRAEVSHPSVWNLWIQPLTGGTARRITDFREGQTWNASWFPDGRRIAYSHEDALTIEDLETGETRRFASPIRGRLVRTPAVSPDGSRIVFQVFRDGVWMLDVRTGRMLCILSDATAEEFAWAPDGRRIAFHSRRNGEWGVFVLSRG
jgi:Tol biopolymer transport system component